MIWKDHQNEEVIWMETFLSAETTAKHGWSLYYSEKELTSKSSILYY